MTHPSEQSPSSSCDAALDYAYGELSGAAKARFEAHLAGCARCQAELASFGRIRAVAQVALPAVEPPASVSGPMHAQLLHAAALRRPAAARGRLLSLPRRVLSHPGWLAAASLLIVGGAVGINWSRGRLFVPPVVQDVAPSTAAPAAATSADHQLAAPAPEATTAGPSRQANTGREALKSMAGKSADDDPALYIDVPKQAPMKVRRIDAPARDKQRKDDAVLDEASGDGKGASFGAVGGGRAAGSGQNQEHGAGLSGMEADAPRQRTEKEQNLPSQNSAPAAAAPPAAQAPAPKPSVGNTKQEEAPVEREQKASNADSLAQKRGLMENLKKKQSCSELLARYGTLNRDDRNLRLSPEESAAYSACLAQTNQDALRKAARGKAKQSPAAGEPATQAPTGAQRR